MTTGLTSDPLEHLDDAFMDELIGCGSPTGSLPSHSTVDSPTTYHAVHMEVQENAKVSTFLLAVDRSGSSEVGFKAPVDSELFLNHQSRHLNNFRDDFLDLAGSVDPTPLSELRSTLTATVHRPVPLPITTASSTKVKDPDSPEMVALTAPPRPSLDAASSKKNQYGFGPKHSVPSVPKAPKRKASNLSNSNSTVAYERKKQRAKDARVKLNDSIEQLSVAIGLAGTQTKQRLGKLQQVAPKLSKEVMQDSVDIAEGAKKWDRPSFVGSAADLIQSLNGQCEALMKYIEDHAIGNALPVEQIAVKRQKLYHFDPSSVVSDTHSPSISPQNDSTLQLPSFQLDQEICTAFRDNPGLIAKISAFLDPVSLARCQRVSKEWKGFLDQKDPWNELAVRRFGFYSVRQWKEKLEDVSSMELYKAMDKANVMPHMPKEGLTFLGESRLPGKVSAWTFLVERSNGETLRTAKRDPSSKDGGANALTPLPLVELRTVIQNTGVDEAAVTLREQTQVVDASTRRRGEEMKEITWDERFQKRVLNFDGTPYERSAKDELCQVGLYEIVVLQTFIHAKSCSTISKFVQKANFTQVLVTLTNGMTVPIVIPFPRDHLPKQL